MTEMEKWALYGKLKNLYNENVTAWDREKYEKFIRKLTEILNL